MAAAQEVLVVDALFDSSAEVQMSNVRDTVDRQHPCEQLVQSFSARGLGPIPVLERDAGLVVSGETLEECSIPHEVQELDAEMPALSRALEELRAGGVHMPLCFACEW